MRYLHQEVLDYVRYVVYRFYPGIPLEEIKLINPADGYCYATNAAFVIAKYKSANKT